jgi:hypothetical protein
MSNFTYKNGTYKVENATVCDRISGTIYEGTATVYDDSPWVSLKCKDTVVIFHENDLSVDIL